jgi:HEAT repeat protein
VTDTAAATRSDGRRVLLLAGQAFALGLLMSWILIPASAIFLSTYGADLLPVTYLGAAIAGVVSSAALSSALRRSPLASVARRVLAGTAIALVAVWALLANDVRWLSFGLLVLVPIVVPMGFMLLVGQAGMLLDVRALKALYARVIAGFALGFVAGGLAAPPLLGLLGRTEHLVLGAAAAGGLWLGLLVLTRHQFRIELSQVEHDDTVDPETAPGWGDLLRHRYVALIVAFQMLSAVESQWLDYLVYERATARYEDSQELARFISRFTAIAYGADIVFLLLIAGLLLRRFGLRYGLTANPAFVLGLVGGVVALSSLQGAGATVVFVLVVAARVTDLVLADGAARTSLSAAYQVVPTPMRLAAQAGVEGMAVPLAIGASGAVLLVLQATVGTAGIVLPVLVAVVVTVWLAVAVLVHRSYRTNLLTSLRFRTLDPSALVLDEANTLAVADGLLDSEDPRDIRLGLDTLALADHPALPERLDLLTRHPRTIVRTDALHRLASVDPERAGAAARRALRDADPSARAASVHVLASLGDGSALLAVEAHRSDDDPDVRVAVLSAMAHLGGLPVRREVAGTIAAWATADDPTERLLAARALDALGPETGVDRAALAALLVDADPQVANAALGATRWPDDRALVGAIAACLGDRATARAAADALVRAGAPALVVVDDSLTGETTDWRRQELLVRVARDVGGEAALEVLARHMGHRDRAVGLAVLSALGRLVTTAEHEGWSHGEVDPSLVILSDLEHATHALRGIVACDAGPGADRVRSALQDELDLLRRRVLAGLSVRYGEDALERVSFQFAKGDSRSHALAVEWLDVTLTGTDRAAVALIEPGLSEAERLRRLSRTLPLPEWSLTEVLHDLVVDEGDRWRQPWVQACAIHAAWSRAEGGLDVTRIEWDATTPSIVAETLAGIRGAELVNGRGGGPGRG